MALLMSGKCTGEFCLFLNMLEKDYIWLPLNFIYINLEMFQMSYLISFFLRC